MKENKLALLILLALLQSGCSLFFGNIRPVEEKSNAYSILDLSKTNPEWQKIQANTNSSSDETKDAIDSAVSDAAFQSQKTASVISINSACRKVPNSNPSKTLKELTRELLLGISDIRGLTETETVVDHIPALQTTLEGKINLEVVQLRTVVFQKSLCVYDLMFVSRPEHFKNDTKTFENFILSLHLKGA